MIEPEEKEDIQHMIDTMLHFLNGGEVLSRPLAYDEDEEKFELDLNPAWNWGRYEYIPAPKKKVLYAVYNGETLVHVATTLAEMEMLQKNPRCLSYGLPITKFAEV
jgi:hypothetical protein